MKIPSWKRVPAGREMFTRRIGNENYIDTWLIIIKSYLTGKT
jgi:hypothetical protein